MNVEYGHSLPISPDEIVAAKRKTIPDLVIEVFNSLIAEYWNGHSSTFKAEEAVNFIELGLHVDRKEIFDKHWLDVEDLYREAGWKVTYDQPGYNESYRAYFRFEKKA